MGKSALRISLPLSMSGRTVTDGEPSRELPRTNDWRFCPISNEDLSYAKHHLDDERAGRPLCPECLKSVPADLISCVSTLNSQLSASPLLNHFFELRTEDTSGVAIKRDMEPIPFLALDDEF